MQLRTAAIATALAAPLVLVPLAGTGTASAHISLCKGYAHRVLPLNVDLIYGDGNVRCPGDAHNTGVTVQASIRRVVLNGPDKTVARGVSTDGLGAGHTTPTQVAAFFCQPDGSSKGRYYTRVSWYATGPHGKSATHKADSSPVTMCTFAGAR